MNSMEQKFQQFQTTRPPMPRTRVALWIRGTAALALGTVGFLLYRLPGGFPPPAWLRLAALVRGHQVQPAPVLLATALGAMALLAGWVLLLFVAALVVRLWRFDPREQLAQPPQVPAHQARAEEASISPAQQAAASRSQGAEAHTPGVQPLAEAHPSSPAADRPGGRSRETLILPRADARRFAQPALLSLLSASSLGMRGAAVHPPMDGSPAVPPLLAEGAGAGMRLAVSAASQPSGADEAQALRESALFSAAGFYPGPTAEPGSASLLPLGLFLLSDGFAFRQAGGFVSTGQVAVQSGALALLPRLSDHPSSAEAESVGRGVLDAILHANATLYRRLAKRRVDGEGEGRAMGTTLAALLVLGTTAFVASVGNSRVYLFRASEGLVQVTYDHAPPPGEVASPSLNRERGRVGEQHEERELGASGPASQARNTGLYRSLGELEQVDPDLFALQLEAGDLLLLCSDALWSRVERATLEETLRRAAGLPVPDPHRACALLCEGALSGGGGAPFSLIVVQAIAVTAQASRHQDASEKGAAMALRKGASGGQ
jgi:PPM family protein phosphatase